MRLILTQMTLKNGCQFQTFPTGWDQRHTCHTIHHTQCKQTIHVHNRDIYGIFRCCHVNPWNKQAIKSCCQQAKTVTLQKNSSCWHENCIYHFKTCFFFSPSCLLLYAPHCFWAGLSEHRRTWMSCLKSKRNSNSFFSFFYKYVSLAAWSWKIRPQPTKLSSKDLPLQCPLHWNYNIINSVHFKSVLHLVRTTLKTSQSRPKGLPYLSL